jgi:hypothetical protein
MQKTDAVMGEQIEVDQKLDHMGAEDFLQMLDGKLREGMEKAVPGEYAVGNKRMDMGMKSEVFAKGGGWSGAKHSSWGTLRPKCGV